MPTYNPYGSGAVTGGNCCQNPMSQFILLRNFFQNMAEGLKETTENLIKVLNSKATFENYDGLGVLITVEVTPPPIAIADNSYFIYVQRYGPPPEGVFDTVLLERIRSEIRDAQTAAGTN